MKIAVFGRSGSKENIHALQKLCKLMIEEELEVVVYDKFWQAIEENEHDIICAYDLFSDFNQIKDSVDYLFSIGGDGTLLNTKQFLIGTDIPVIGINTGRLGFLAHFTVDDIDEIVTTILQGNQFENDYRQLLEITCNDSIFGNKPIHALNEFTLQKKEPSSVIKVKVYIDNEFLSSYWADGVILATPTGSTGYSMSAGGPIMMPQSNSLVITPIAVHNLNQRPIIISNTSEVKFTISEHRGDSYCSIDSKFWQIKEDFEFTVKKSNFVMNILRPNHSPFVDTLRDKLFWGVDNRNK